jgi:hypothetical protein
MALIPLRQEPKGDPSPDLEMAARMVNLAWGATSTMECQSAIEGAFSDETELFLTTEQFAGILGREAMLAMAKELDRLQGVNRSWTTDEERWYLSDVLAVRKAREKLHERGESRSVLTTNVFELRDAKWVLVHAHHSEYAAESKEQ